MICDEQSCCNAHNEDNDVYFINHNHSAIFEIKLGKTSFVAFNYLGDLPTQAFGFNNYGIGFSINWVSTTNSLKAGLATNFIRRFLLDAESYEDAVEKINIVGQGGGNNFNLFDFKNRRISTIEHAPIDTYSLR